MLILALRFSSFVRNIILFFIAGGKLAALEEFKIQREELMEKMEDLEQELYDIDRTHKENVYMLERKQVIDKDRSVATKRVQSFPSDQRRQHTQQDAINRLHCNCHAS